MDVIDILYTILNYLKLSDIKNMRSVSKSFAPVKYYLYHNYCIDCEYIHKLLASEYSVIRYIRNADISDVKLFPFVTKITFEPDFNSPLIILPKTVTEINLCTTYNKYISPSISASINYYEGVPDAETDIISLSEIFIIENNCTLL